MGSFLVRAERMESIVCHSGATYGRKGCQFVKKVAEGVIYRPVVTSVLCIWDLIDCVNHYCQADHREPCLTSILSNKFNPTTYLMPQPLN
jgi:hypothetical protein